MNRFDLSNIELITFDVFGTLLDWQSYVEGFFPGKFAQFCLLSKKMQVMDHPKLPYEDLLTEVALEMGLKESDSREFSYGLGRALRFADHKSLARIAKIVKVGCISNSDAIHQLDVQAQLNVHWDFHLLCNESACYKPSARIWDVAKIKVQKELSLATDEWLHVSAYLDFDLVDVRNAGIFTAFVSRPGGSNMLEVETFAPDLMISDLDQLHEGLLRAKGLPQVLILNVDCEHERLVRELIRLVRQEGVGIFNDDPDLRLEAIQLGKESMQIIVRSRKQLAFEACKVNFMQQLESKFPVHLMTFRWELGSDIL